MLQRVDTSRTCATRLTATDGRPTGGPREVWSWVGRPECTGWHRALLPRDRWGCVCGSHGWPPWVPAAALGRFRDGLGLGTPFAQEAAWFREAGAALGAAGGSAPHLRLCSLLGTAGWEGTPERQHLSEVRRDCGGTVRQLYRQLDRRGICGGTVRQLYRQGWLFKGESGGRRSAWRSMALRGAAIYASMALHGSPRHRSPLASRSRS